MEDSNYNLVTKECPQCGASIELKHNKCAFCNTEFYIKRIDELGNKTNKYKTLYTEILKSDAENIEALYGLGLCFVSLSLFERAKSQFDLVIKKNPDHANALFYYCISILACRSIRTISHKEAKEIESNLNASIIIDPDNYVYHRALACLKYDYYVLNGLKQTNPDYQELLLKSDSLIPVEKELITKYFKSNLNI